MRVPFYIEGPGHAFPRDLKRIRGLASESKAFRQRDPQRWKPWGRPMLRILEELRRASTAQRRKERWGEWQVRSERPHTLRGPENRPCRFQPLGAWLSHGSSCCPESPTSPRLILASG